MGKLKIVALSIFVAALASQTLNHYLTLDVLNYLDKTEESIPNSNIGPFRTCLSRKGVPSSRLVDPLSNSTSYDALNFQWNIKFPKVYPIAILLPQTTQHVAAAVQCGVSEGIRLIPNSGGHSYDSISWGDDTTLVLDFVEMNKVELEGSVAVIQPGALLGPVVAKLWSLGKVGLPLGVCSTVGMGGHAIGGGIGVFSHVYGLLIDNVLEYEVVTAAGNVVTANHKENPDLFWALRGIGPGYIGIITGLRIKTFEADRIKVTAIKLNYPLREFVRVGRATQDFIGWTRKNDPKILTWAMAFSDDWNVTNSVTPGSSEPGVVITAFHIHDPELNPSSNAIFLAKIKEMFPPTKNKIVAFPSYLELYYATSYSPVILPTTGNKDPVSSPTFSSNSVILSLLSSLTKESAIPRYFKAKSLFVKRRLTEAELERLAQLMTRIPANRAGLMVTSETGAIHEIPRNATAYVHRSMGVNFRVHIEGGPEDGDIEEAKVWLDKFWVAMASFDGGATYQNFPDLDVKDYLKRYYGSNLERIVAIKRKWDPKNYFRNAQSLPTSLKVEVNLGILI